MTDAGSFSLTEIMIRVIHGPKDRVTPFDLKVQTFRVNVEFSTYHHEQKKS